MDWTPKEPRKKESIFSDNLEILSEPQTLVGTYTLYNILNTHIVYTIHILIHIQLYTYTQLLIYSYIQWTMLNSATTINIWILVHSTVHYTILNLGTGSNNDKHLDTRT